MTVGCTVLNKIWCMPSAAVADACAQQKLTRAITYYFIQYGPEHVILSCANSMISGTCCEQGRNRVVIPPAATFCALSNCKRPRAGAHVRPYLHSRKPALTSQIIRWMVQQLVSQLGYMHVISSDIACKIWLLLARVSSAFVPGRYGHLSTAVQPEHVCPRE